MISGERTEQLDLFCRVNGFTSDFLSFIDVELIRFFHRALHLLFCILDWAPCKHLKLTVKFVVLETWTTAPIHATIQSEKENS